MNFFDEVYFGNAIHSWAIALGVAIGTTVLLSIFKRIVVHRLGFWRGKPLPTLMTSLLTC